jgi:uncharacterized protein
VADIDLRELRLRHGLTQAQVAERAGVKQPEVSAIENGGSRATTDGRARILAAIRALAEPTKALTPDVRAAAQRLFEQVGATDVAVFGSLARGTSRPGSDVDLVATFPPEFSLFDLIELSESLETVIGLRVDIVSDDPRSGHVVESIRDGAVPLVTSAG